MFRQGMDWSPPSWKYLGNFLTVNIRGAENIVRAIENLDLPIETVVGISTDKACKPVNVMGMTKAIQERIFISANLRHRETRFLVVRYGNVLGSRGSVVPLFKKLAADGQSLPITDKRMTRFWITLPDAVQFVIDSFDAMQGGELYVPRIPSMRMTDLAEATAGRVRATPA